MKTTDNTLSWIPIPTLFGYKTIETDEIKYLKARNSQTIIFLTGKTEYIISNESLNHYEKVLKKKNFLRIHKSYIINLKYLDSFLKGKDAHVLLKHNISLNVALTYRDSLLEVLKRMR